MRHSFIIYDTAKSGVDNTLHSPPPLTLHVVDLLAKLNGTFLANTVSS